ncbi:MAG: beta-eliminating lyase-related protein [Intrasporangium sp.]|uniref:threonine aldolase family protein n=1 Tax=Intrasporangium sp. TaxID=1925024 RepID=UPI002649FCB5|nr:GntG family PLP-dependent aldolase [Intrasporangium sp.]MDN5795046.1 beta-eliminating lyase-related protein [Intrasporangium sp.]
MSGASIVADLLSDTLTRPTPAMREAMAQAEVGDDVFGEDPTLRALEERVAGLIGQPAGLFTPSGSMANQLGVRLHAGPGAELVADSLAHVVRAELGAAAALSGITSRTWVAEAGRFRAEDAAAMMVTGVGPYQVCTGVVVVENTHNFGGGTVQSLEEIRAARRLTRAAGVAMHLDGARLWNAHVATGVALADYGREFDTVSVCLSKGLGAPVGSVLLGSAEAMAEARVWRKRFGGGMRQAGILAAAGLYALDHNIERLAEDHARAHRAAVAMADAAPGSVVPDSVGTNIVIADVSAAGWTAPNFVAAALERGVRLYAVGPALVRLVWHLDVDDAATDHAVDVVTDLLAPERTARGRTGR